MIKNFFESSTWKFFIIIACFVNILWVFIRPSPWHTGFAIASGWVLGTYYQKWSGK